MYKVKDYLGQHQLKDVDTTKGTVRGILSAFGVVDSDGDMLMPGAFKKSIMERGPESASTRKIAFLRGHNTDKPVGKFTKLYETSEGLEYEAQMSKSSLGQDTLILMQEGIMNNHSVGYIRMPDKEQMQDQYNEVKEVKLMEGSVLMFGANSETPVLSVKGDTAIEKADDLSKRIDRLIRVIRKGNLQDEMCQLLEIELEQIKAIQKALVTAEPSTDTLRKNEPLDLVAMFNSKFNNDGRSTRTN